MVLKAGDMERVMPELIWHLEDLRVGQCYPNYYVARLASKFVQGRALRHRRRRAVRRLSVALLPRGRQRRRRRLTSIATTRSGSGWCRTTVIPRLFQPDVWAQIKDIRPIDVMRDVVAGATGPLERPEDYVNRSLYFECKTFLHGLLVVEDKLSMAHGLETRVPFLDNDLVDFAMRVPVRAKLRDLDLRRAARRKRRRPEEATSTRAGPTTASWCCASMLSRLLPPSYVDGAKQGFSAPDASWFRGDSIDYVRRLILDPNARIYSSCGPTRSASWSAST